MPALLPAISDRNDVSIKAGVGGDGAVWRGRSGKHALYSVFLPSWKVSSILHH